MKDVVFVSVAFGMAYVRQINRLKKSIEKIYPKANTMFWVDKLPRGSHPFLESLYGFKPHAIDEARKQYSRAIWLDPAMILVDKVDDLISQDKLIAVRDDSKLYNVISDKCYDYFNLDKEEVKAKDWHLVGGSLYFFNFENPTTCEILDEWLRAERNLIFGSQDEASTDKLQGHRYDEAVMAILMYLNGVEPVGPDVIRYCQGSNSMFIKKHFK